MFVWTDDRVELLRKCWAEGLSASQTAKQLGCITRNAVIGKVHRLGLEKRGPQTRINTNAIKTARIRAKKVREPAPPRKIIAAAEPVIDRAPLDPLGPEIAQAPAHTCLWINGDPMIDGRTCGRHAEDGSWCKHHRALVYVKPKANLSSIERFAHWSDRNRVNPNMAIFGGPL